MPNRRVAARVFGPLALHLGLAGVLASPLASATQPPGVTAQLACRPEAAPGRVLCELKYRAAPGLRLVWADALVTKTPDFVRPLRSRISPERFSDETPGERKLSLGFVASQAGVGQISVQARAVVCRGAGQAESCRSESQHVVAEVRVGF
jgi:hypothetical protein